MALPNGQYTVGWICALQTEETAACEFLDEEHGRPSSVAKNDTNHYVLGRMAGHNIVIAVLPAGLYGTSSATSVARDMVHSFPNVRIGLMVGIGGGAPSIAHDIRLGDVVVSTPAGFSGGVFQYDFGKTIQDRKFQHTGHLNHTPTVLLTAVQGLASRFERKGNGIAERVEAVLAKNKRLRKKYGQPDPESDILYASNVVHPHDEGKPRQSCIAVCGCDSEKLVGRLERSERDDNPMVFQGIIASANSLMKDALIRDKLAQENGVLCFEMEAAGLMNNFPCLVVRGICDYSDSHKNDAWHGYAAMSAAAYAKEILLEIAPTKLEAQQKLIDSMKNIEESIGAVKSATTEIHSTVKDIDTDQKHSHLIKWLRPCDPSTNHLSARSQHFTGSCSWLVQQDPRFAEWKTQPHSFLWLYGLPGCGKTVLSSTIIESLSESHMCLYFYFTFQEQEKLSLDSMLRVLLWQLFSKHEAAKQVLNQLHASCEQGSPGNPRQPSTKELSIAFSNMLKLGQEVWIVIDALDECSTRKNSENTQGLIAWIETTVSSNLDNVHLLVTSREEEDFRSGFKDLSDDGEFIPIEGKGLEMDIKTYIEAKITHGDELKRWRKMPEIQQNIQTKVLEKATGMFRYVACQIRDLETCIDRESLYNALENLPKDLNETYSRIMARIPLEYRPKTIRVLQLLIYSGRPLGVEELVDAVAVNPEKTTPFDPLDRMPEPTEIARYCSSLTKFVTKRHNHPLPSHRKKTELHLAHFSVKEYLISSPEHSWDFNEMVARASIAKVCVSYLRQVRPTPIVFNCIDLFWATKFPFFGYSAKNWLKNAAATERQNEEILNMTIDFLLSFDKSYYKHWTFYFQNHEERPWNDREEPDTPLWYACHAGLSIHCLERILEEGKDKGLTVRDGKHARDSLHAASERGDLDTMRFLIKKGAVVRDEHFYTPCEGGDEKTVKLLLEYVQPDQWGEWNPGGFVRACQNGHLRIVELLIERNPEFANAELSSGMIRATPLMQACTGGHEEIALLLLQHGARVMDKRSSRLAFLRRYQTALGAAAARGLEKVVKTMVENHSAVPQWYEFSMSVKNGHAGIVQILWDCERLDKKDLDRALFYAAESGHDSIVLLLLRLGANIDSSGEYESQSRTALEVARRLGHEKVVLVLLQKGAKDEFGVQHDNSEESQKDQKDQEDQELEDDQEFNGDHEPEDDHGSDEHQESDDGQETEEDQESKEHQQVDEGQGRDDLIYADAVASNAALNTGGPQENCSKQQRSSLKIDRIIPGSDMRDEIFEKNPKDKGPELDDSRHDGGNLNEGCDLRGKDGETLDKCVGQVKSAGQLVANRAALEAEKGSQHGEGDDDEQKPIKARNERKQVNEHAKDSRQKNRSCGWNFAWLNPRGGKRWGLSVTCWTTETDS